MTNSNFNSTFDVSDLTNSASKTSAVGLAAAQHDSAATDLSSISKTYEDSDQELIPDDGVSDIASTEAFAAQEAYDMTRRRAEIEAEASNDRLETQIREANLAEERALALIMSNAAAARDKAQASARQEQYELKLRLLDAEVLAKIASSKGSVRSLGETASAVR